MWAAVRLPLAFRVAKKVVLKVIRLTPVRCNWLSVKGRGKIAWIKSGNEGVSSCNSSARDFSARLLVCLEGIHQNVKRFIQGESEFGKSKFFRFDTTPGYNERTHAEVSLTCLWRLTVRRPSERLITNSTWDRERKNTLTDHIGARGNTGELKRSAPLWGQRAYNTCLPEREPVMVKRQLCMAVGKKPKYLHCLGRSYTSSLDESVSRGGALGARSVGQLNTEKLTGAEMLTRLWIESFRDPKAEYRSLEGYMKQLDLWTIAYQKLAGNPGSLTPGPDGITIDGTNLSKLKKLRDEVVSGKFRWGGTRRVYIPKHWVALCATAGKRGSTKSRPTGPLGIPTLNDRIVQEVIRMILEPIFEPQFSKNSHGFRPGRGPNTALRRWLADFQACAWYIEGCARRRRRSEGDIRKFFDTVDHGTLINLIKRRVKDGAFLQLLKKGLETRIIHPEGETEISKIWVPQGGVLSPLLSNIYLDELDRWVERKQEEIEGGLFLHSRPQAAPLRNNPEYIKLTKRLRDPHISPRTLYRDSINIHIRYIRFVDDFIVGINGPRALATLLCEELADFLKTTLNVELNIENTLITHISKGVGFLGHRLNRRAQVIRQRFKGRRQRRREAQGWAAKPPRARLIRYPTLDVDLDKYRKKLAQNGFCQRDGKPKPNFAFLHLPQSETNMIINQVLAGYKGWFISAGNCRSALSYINHILRYSVAKVYAAKYKLASVAMVLRKGGNDLSIPLAARRGREVGVTDGLIERWEKQVTREDTHRRIPGILYSRYHDTPKPNKTALASTWRPDHEIKIMKCLSGESKQLQVLKGKILKIILEELTEGKSQDPMNRLKWRLAKGVKALLPPCSVCGSKQRVEMHHVRRFKEIERRVSAVSPLYTHVIAMKRKQIPLCYKCHREAHRLGYTRIFSSRK